MAVDGVGTVLVARFFGLEFVEADGSERPDVFISAVGMFLSVLVVGVLKTAENSGAVWNVRRCVCSL